MNVRLISITKSLIDEKYLSAEELIVYIARVSNPSNQLNVGSSERLLRFMIKHGHWSPFEMCDMTVEIKTSRAIAQQIIRHRSFSFQEYSQRYSEAIDVEPIEIRRSGATNRQSSLEIFDPVLNGGEVSASKLIDKHIEESKLLYKNLLESGVAKECARFILPLAAQSTIYMKGSIRSWIHYLGIRTQESTQKEHRIVALAIKEIFGVHFPIIAKQIEFS